MRSSPPRRSGSTVCRWWAIVHEKHGTNSPARAWQTSRAGQTLRRRRRHLVRATGRQLRARARAVRADRDPFRGLLHRWRVLGRVGSAVRTATCDDQGDRMVVLAGQAIRGVALGVVVTALVQSLLGGIGLAIAGVPFAGH